MHPRWIEYKEYLRQHECDGLCLDVPPQPHAVINRAFSEVAESKCVMLEMSYGAVQGPMALGLRM